MRGPVIGLSRDRRFAAIHTESGHAVVELIGSCDVQLGDIVAGDLEMLGGGSLWNENRREAVDIFVQDTDRSPAMPGEFLM